MFAYTALGENPPPSVPTNFYGTGSQGQNPTLHWDSVVEPDIDYLELKRTVTGQGGGNRVFTLSPGTTQYTDNTVEISRFGFATIKYKLRSVDYASQYSGYTNPVTYSGEGFWKQMADFEIIPDEYALHAAFPNPFNPATSIRFDLPERSRVSMIIYDVLGREIKTLIHNTIEPGFNEIKWGGKDNNGNPVPTGMYIYRFSAFSEESEKRFNKSNKLVLMK
ncbi:MAG: FlgD immunoglobulin-like domain containing protein [Fidelibacterota bacterium]